MTETKSISQWFKNENSALKDRARERLAKMGILPGVKVRTKDGATFHLTHVEYAGITPYGGSISVHGRKYRRDGTLGNHKHYIGCPEDVKVVP